MGEDIDVITILQEWLKANGYDGLYNEECGCGIDDLVPCGGPYDTCRPGYNCPALCPEEKVGAYYRWISPEKAPPLPPTPVDELRKAAQDVITMLMVDDSCECLNKLYAALSPSANSGSGL